MQVSINKYYKYNIMEKKMKIDPKRQVVMSKEIKRYKREHISYN